MLQEKSKTNPSEVGKKITKVHWKNGLADINDWFHLLIFFYFTVRYVRANVDFDHGTKVNFSPDTR